MTTTACPTWSCCVKVISEDPNDPFTLAVELAQMILPVPLEHAAINQIDEEFPGDPNFPPPAWVLEAPEHIQSLVKILLDGLPHYNWPDLVDGGEEAYRQGHRLLKEYIVYLMERPAYQLT